MIEGFKTSQNGRGGPLCITLQRFRESFEVLDRCHQKTLAVDPGKRAVSGPAESVFVFGLGKDVLATDSQLAADHVAVPPRHASDHVSSFGLLSQDAALPVPGQLMSSPLPRWQGFHLAPTQQWHMRRDATINKLGYKTTRSVACITGEHLNGLLQAQNVATRLVFGYQFEGNIALSRTRRNRGPAPQYHTALSIDDVVYEITERGALALTLAVEPGIGICTRSVCLVRIAFAVAFPNTLRLRPPCL